MPADFTTHSFIDHARLVHGLRYDYAAARYSGIDAPITIVCRPHGGFITTPSKHLTGEGCPKCQQ